MKVLPLTATKTKAFQAIYLTSNSFDMPNYYQIALQEIQTLNNDPYQGLTRMQHASIDVKELSWFEYHIGKEVFVSCAAGGHGIVKVKGHTHAAYLHRMNQEEDIRFIIMEDRHSQLHYQPMTITETCHDKEWLEMFLDMIES